MNYLAHLLLSADAPEAMTGNLMADFVKGPALAELPPAVQQGVLVHRAVDAFTDSHPLHVQSRSRLGPRWARVSGILIDIWYDHVLARDWHRYHGVPLRHYLDHAYAQFLSCCRTLPESYHVVGHRLVGEDLLMTYREAEGIERALERLSRRLCGGRFGLGEAMADLRRLDAELAEDFHLFFPELQAFAASLGRESQSEAAKAWNDNGF